MANLYDNFEGGKVVVALRYIPGGLYPVDLFERALEGLDCRRVEIIFPAAGDGVGKVLLVHLECKKRETVVKAVRQLSANPLVAYAEANYRFDRHGVSSAQQVVPDDAYFGRLWGMRAIRMPEAWEFATDCGEVVVGVLDSGVDVTHPDMVGNVWEHGGWNFAVQSADASDLTGHGTHIAGTVGAVGNNRIGVAGVCWQVRIAPMKIGDHAFDLAAAVAGIDYARSHGIGILNNSWGGRYESDILRHAIGQYDGLFVASAGNAGTDNDVGPEFPASFENGNIISVAATDPGGALATFSNYGAVSVDIAAPGTDIYSLEPGGGYVERKGTSMAAPHVAGAAALLKAHHPGLSAADMKRIILESANKQPALDGKVAMGGMLDVRAMLSTR